jgi:hypothetical protein
MQFDSSLRGTFFLAVKEGTREHLGVLENGVLAKILETTREKLIG